MQWGKKNNQRELYVQSKEINTKNPQICQYKKSSNSLNTKNLQKANKKLIRKQANAENFQTKICKKFNTENTQIYKHQRERDYYSKNLSILNISSYSD